MRILFDFYDINKSLTKDIMLKYFRTRDNQNCSKYDAKSSKFIPYTFEKFKYLKNTPLQPGDEEYESSIYPHCDMYIIPEDSDIIYGHMLKIQDDFYNDIRKTVFECSPYHKMCVYNSEEPRYGNDYMRYNHDDPPGKYIIFFDYESFEKFAKDYDIEFTLIRLHDTIENKIIPVENQPVESIQLFMKEYIRNYLKDENHVILMKYDLGNDKYLSKPVN